MEAVLFAAASVVVILLALQQTEALLWIESLDPD